MYDAGRGMRWEVIDSAIIIFPNISPMLLNTRRKQTPSLSFLQELDYLKHPPQPAPSKHQEYFTSMNTVLDLLLQAHPTLTDSLLILKQVLKKWYQHLQEQSVGKNRQLMEMRERLVVYVSKEIGITLEEIGMYIKRLTDYYSDEDMRRLYGQFLQAVRKLEWQQPVTPCRHIACQTDEEEQSIPPTAKSITTNPLHPSQATIDSPHRKFKEFDVQKYIKTKEENLDLQRKINQLNAKISDLSAQNKALKREISQLHDQNQQCRNSRQKELKEVAKLKQLLGDLKNEQQARAQREEQKRNSFNNADRRFDQCQSIKNALHQSLYSAQMELFNNAQTPYEEEEEQLAHNYRSASPTNGHHYQTIKKQPKIPDYFEEGGSSLRMLLIQALTIQSYLTQEEEDS